MKITKLANGDGVAWSQTKVFFFGDGVAWPQTNVFLKKTNTS